MNNKPSKKFSKEKNETTGKQLIRKYSAKTEATTPQQVSNSRKEGRRPANGKSGREGAIIEGPGRAQVES